MEINHQSIIAGLKSFATKPELLTSAEFKKCQPYLNQLLTTAQTFTASGTEPFIKDFVRLAHWNIEKGKYLDSVIDAFLTHPILRYADIISINEADVGMNRSHQAHVAQALGDALKMHVAFAPCYLEFSKGYGDDLLMEGENTTALQGNAILSRYPMLNPCVIELPLCYDHFEHVEKRIGNRNALMAEFEIKGRRLAFVSTHLEVRNAPSCRAKQVAAIVQKLEKPEAPTSVIIAGDFNSNTFARGGMITTMQGFLRLMFSNADRLRASIKAPQSREPLFALLQKHGFIEAGFNSDDVSCYVPMTILEDSAALPGFLTKAINRQMARYNGQLDFRLDWMLGRNVMALGDEEITDGKTKIASLKPHTISGLRNKDGSQIADHDPITFDLKL